MMQDKFATQTLLAHAFTKYCLISAEYKKTEMKIKAW